MANLTVRNFPDELYGQIQYLAEQHNQPIEYQIVELLIQALQFQPLPLAPETQLTSELAGQTVSQVMAEINHRRNSLPPDRLWLDSTSLIREERDRR